ALSSITGGCRLRLAIAQLPRHSMLGIPPAAGRSLSIPVRHGPVLGTAGESGRDYRQTLETSTRTLRQGGSRHDAAAQPRRLPRRRFRRWRPLKKRDSEELTAP